MARIVQCPRCQAKFDAQNFPAGTTVPCAACGALTRIPAPSNPAQAAIPEAVPVGTAPPSRPPTGSTAAAGRRGRGRKGGARGGTRVMRKGSNTGLVLGLSLGGVALLIVVIALVATKENPPPKQPPTSGPTAPPPVAPTPVTPTPEPAGTETAANPETSKGPITSSDPNRADWGKLMRNLRAGGAFDQPDRPEGQAFQIVKSMGKGAYPPLVKYIDETYYLSVRRYTTSAFLRLKLGNELAKRRLSPRVYETAEEARGRKPAA